MKKVLLLFILIVLGGLVYWFNPFKNKYIRTVHFQVEIPAKLTDLKIGIRGNLPPLSWDKTIYLTKADSNVFETKQTFNSSIKNLEYKYVVEGKSLEWELNKGLNRNLEYRYHPVEKWNNYSATRPYGLDTSLITGNQLSKDLLILEKALSELHPSLTKYQSQVSYNTQLEKLKTCWSTSLKKPDAYIQLAEFLATIKCGHTQLNPYNQGNSVLKALIKRKNKLPFTFVILEGKAYVDKVMSGTPLQKGDEIMSIAGNAWSEINKKLLAVARGDGSNDGNRIARLPITGHGKHEFFDVYFPMMFSLPQEKVIVDIKRKENQKSINVPLVSVEERTKDLKSKFPALVPSDEDLWKWEILEGNIGYLKLETYTTWNFDFDWEKRIEDAMSTFKTSKTKDIIIDIRGNEGGNDDVLEYLAKYVQVNPIKTGGYPEVIKYQKVSDDLRPYLRTWNDDLYNVALFTKKYKEEYFIRRGSSTQKKTIPASKDALDARFHYLVDATNSSATFNQAKLIKENKLGTLIGETTGGNYRGITGGYMFFLKLPESGFTVDIPLSTTWMPEETPDKGVAPDVEVKYSFEGFMTNRDEVLEGALSYIKTF